MTTRERDSTKSWPSTTILNVGLRLWLRLKRRTLAFNHLRPLTSTLGSQHGALIKDAFHRQVYKPPPSAFLNATPHRLFMQEPVHVHVHVHHEPNTHKDQTPDSFSADVFKLDFMLVTCLSFFIPVVPVVLFVGFTGYGMSVTIRLKTGLSADRGVFPLI